jgi:hypothetical protein
MSLNLYRPRNGKDARLVENFRRAFYDWMRAGHAIAEFDVPGDVDRPLGREEETLPAFFTRIAGDLAHGYDRKIADVRQVLHGGAQLWVIIKLDTGQRFYIYF